MILMCVVLLGRLSSRVRIVLGKRLVIRSVRCRFPMLGLWVGLLMLRLVSRRVTRLLLRVSMSVRLVRRLSSIRIMMSVVLRIVWCIVSLLRFGRSWVPWGRRMGWRLCRC